RTGTPPDSPVEAGRVRLDAQADPWAELCRIGGRQFVTADSGEEPIELLSRHIRRLRVGGVRVPEGLPAAQGRLRDRKSVVEGKSGGLGGPGRIRDKGRDKKTDRTGGKRNNEGV